MFSSRDLHVYLCMREERDRERERKLSRKKERGWEREEIKNITTKIYGKKNVLINVDHSRE